MCLQLSTNTVCSLCDQHTLGAWISTRARICKRLRSPGIDSNASIPSAFVAWRAGTSNRVNRVVVPGRQAGNRFLGSWKGLQIRPLYKRSVCFNLAPSGPLLPPPHTLLSLDKTLTPERTTIRRPTLEDIIYFFAKKPTEGPSRLTAGGRTNIQRIFRALASLFCSFELLKGQWRVMFLA